MQNRMPHVYNLDVVADQFQVLNRVRVPVRHAPLGLSIKMGEASKMAASSQKLHHLFCLVGFAPENARLDLMARDALFRSRHQCRVYSF